MYKFKNFHASGEVVRYVKMTEKTYYCRIPRSDGTNRFCYLNTEDAGGPGETEFSLTEKEYKAVRGVTACKMTALNANLRVLAGKLHYVTFGFITRNITRLLKTPISH